MFYKLTIVIFICLSFQLFGKVEESSLPQMDIIYNQDFGKKINTKQKESMHYAIQHQHEKLRVMTYNMLYNEKSAEALLLKNINGMQESQDC